MFRWTEAAISPAPQAPRAPANWRRVSRSAPCPICGRSSWCGVTTDGSAAICMRIADGAAHQVDLGHGVGHIHQLEHDRAQQPTYLPPRPERSGDWDLDFDAILERWSRSTPPEAIDDLAAELGVERQAIARLDAVYCPEQRAWAFPMHDDRRQIVGVRLRGPRGKWALRGSHSGAFIPRGLDSRSLLLICEGPTDTAAALSLGYMAVGRPSCSGATEILCELLHNGRPRDVVIVADSDGPGRFGARRLATRLRGLCRNVGPKIISAAPHKDLRSWLQGGATADALRLRIEQATYYVDEHGCADHKKGAGRVDPHSQGRGRRNRGAPAGTAVEDPAS